MRRSVRQASRRSFHSSWVQKKEAGHYSGLNENNFKSISFLMRRRSFTPYFTHGNLHFCIAMT